MESQKKCLNCDEVTTQNYCSNCGQRCNVPKITFKEIFADFLNSVFNLDSPFLKTITQLFTKPKEVVIDYINGKRKTYYSPIRYLVVCLFINLLFGELVGFDPIENQKAINGSREINEGARQGYEIGRFLAKYLNYFLFLLPFCIAMVSKIFFRKTISRVTERSVFGFYMSGQYINVTLLPIALTLIHPTFMLLIYPITILYLTYGFYKVFYIRSKFIVLVKSFFSSLLSILLYYILAVILAYYIMNIFNLQA